MSWRRGPAILCARRPSSPLQAVVKCVPRRCPQGIHTSLRLASVHSLIHTHHLRAPLRPLPYSHYHAASALPSQPPLFDLDATLTTALAATTRRIRARIPARPSCRGGVLRQLLLRAPQPIGARCTIDFRALLICKDNGMQPCKHLTPNGLNERHGGAHVLRCAYRRATFQSYSGAVEAVF